MMSPPTPPRTPPMILGDAEVPVGAAVSVAVLFVSEAELLVSVVEGDVVEPIRATQRRDGHVEQSV